MSFWKFYWQLQKQSPFGTLLRSQFFHMKRFRSFPSSWILNKLLKNTGEFMTDNTSPAPDFIRMNLWEDSVISNEINFQLSFFSICFSYVFWLNAELSKHSLRVICCELIKKNCEWYVTSVMKENMKLHTICCLNLLYWYFLSMLVLFAFYKCV